MADAASKANIAACRARSVLEQQRILAMYSNNFYKEILPAMYDASIINQERLVFLMASRETESQITTRELLELAVAWDVTSAPSEFWKTHKSRDDLINALRRRKEELEKAALEQEQQPFFLHSQNDSDGSDTEGNGTKQRRNSLMVLGSLFPGKETQGDLFGTQGEYTDGIIYMARRVPMDRESALDVKQKIKASAALARAARLHARRRMQQDGADETEAVDRGEEWLNQLDVDLDSKLGGQAADATAASPTSAAQSPAMSPVAAAAENPNGVAGPAKDAPGPSPRVGFVDVLPGSGHAADLSRAATRTEDDESAYGSPAGTAGRVGAQQSVTDVREEGSGVDGVDPQLLDGVPKDVPLMVNGRLRVVGRDGRFHRVGSIRFNDGEQPVDDEPEEAEEEPFTFMRFVEKNCALEEQVDVHVEGITTSAFMQQQPRAGGTVRFEDEGRPLSLDTTGNADTPAVSSPRRLQRLNSLGMEDIQVPTTDDFASSVRIKTAPTPGASEASSAPHSAEYDPLQTSSSSASITSPSQKVSLYFRPVTEANRMVVVIPSRNDPIDYRNMPGLASMRKGGNGSAPGTPADTLDAFVHDTHQKPLSSPMRPLSGSNRSTSAESIGAIHGTTRLRNSTASPVLIAAASPALSPMSELPEKLAIRHRLGGKAGVLARSLSVRLAAEAPLREYTMSGQQAPLPPDAEPSPRQNNQQSGDEIIMAFS